MRGLHLAGPDAAGKGEAWLMGSRAGDTRRGSLPPADSAVAALCEDSQQSAKSHRERELTPAQRTGHDYAHGFHTWNVGERLT